MSTKQVYRNIDFTNTSAYLTIKEYEKILGIKFDPNDKYQRNSPAYKDSTVPQFPSAEHKQLSRLVDMDLRAKSEIEPIKSVISHMNRFKVFQTDKEGRSVQKEVMIVIGNYTASDYIGNELNQGFQLGWYKSPKIKFIPENPREPNARDKYGNRLGSVKPTGEFEYIYTIEVPQASKARKALVDKIIAEHKGSFKENILFGYRDHKPTTVGPQGSAERSSSYSYDQFIKCELSELHRLLHKKYGPDGSQPWYNSETGKWEDELGNIIERRQDRIQK